MKHLSLIGVALFAFPLLVACSSADPAGSAVGSGSGEGKCEAGESSACKCGGKSGKKTCSDDGTFDACDCSEKTASTTIDPPAATPPAAAPVCNELKACEGLVSPGTFKPASDLGVKLEAASKPQILAELRAQIAAGSMDARYLAAALGHAQAGEPSTVTAIRNVLETNADIRARVTRHLGELGFGELEIYRARFPAIAGQQLMEAPLPNACAPSLRMRVAKITVHEEDDDFANDQVYCSVSAQANDIQELRVTPKTKPLDEGDSQSFSGEESVFWGQGKARDPKGGDITIKYDCFEAESNAGYAALLGAAAAAAKKHGDKVVTGDNAGYVAVGADIVSAFLPTLLALDSDDHLFKATQILPAAKHMELANGATWSVKKSGSNSWSDWEWSLTMEAWGCSVNGAAK